MNKYSQCNNENGSCRTRWKLKHSIRLGNTLKTVRTTFFRKFISYSIIKEGEGTESVIKKNIELRGRETATRKRYRAI